MLRSAMKGNIGLNLTYLAAVWWHVYTSREQTEAANAFA